MVRPLRDLSSLLQAGSRVVVTASGETIPIPRLASPGAAASATEGAAATGTDPTFDQVSWGAYELAQPIITSRRLVEDSAIDIEGLIGSLIGENIGVLLGQRLATGTGTGQTLGLANAATVGVTGAGTAPTFDELIDLETSVPAPYRTLSSWVVADTALATLRKEKDANGHYLWQPAVTLGQPDLIHGRPVYPDANMTVGNSAVSVLYGDFSRFWVRVVNNLRIERSDHIKFLERQIAFLGVMRADAVLTDLSAIKSFKGKTPS
jgi:HK97 family phage major capsid protein